MGNTNIWFDYEWYVSVTDEGYVNGPCFEGMLGCVVQIQSASSDTEQISTAALKIPRLLADTIEENYYICKLTEDERRAVKRINTSGGSVDGLVPSQWYGNPPLQKGRELRNSDDPEAVAQDGHVIFVAFERDKKPRFCSVALKGDTFDVIPKGCKEAFELNVTPDQWRTKFNSPRSQPFSAPVYSSKDLNQGDQSGELKNALERTQTTVWYAGLPAIVFSWAGGNLQETITKKEIGQWSLEQHFGLFEQLLRGVRFLHKHGIIHGDIRPANAMWIGDPEAANYKLGDYGSYGRDWELVSNENSATGLTMVGPAIGLRRQTAFYSPERRAGKEFESADTAIISPVSVENQHGGKSTNYIILLGWRSALIDKGEVSADVRNLISEWGAQAVATKAEVNSDARNLNSEWESQAATTRAEIENNPDELQSGDRLRLRNYLFDVIRSERRSDLNQKLFLCSGRYAEILHDSLVVFKVNQPIKEQTVLDLSNYVEFQQWSAASDLFSVGAVCLYSLFCGGLQKGGVDAGESELENPDRLFTEMIAILESVEWFKDVWEELETFRQTTEELYLRDPQPSPEEAREHKVVVSLNEGQTEERTLFETAMHATSSILGSTPKAQILLGAFGGNLAYFLLFIHFALACLHRKSHLDETKGERASSLTPFAADRIEQPREKGAAAEALKRLYVIKGYLNQPFFKRFTCTGEEYEKILKYDYRTDFQVRRDLEKEKAKNATLHALVTSKDDRISQLREILDNASREMARLTEESIVRRDDIKRLSQERRSRDDVIARLNEEAGKRKAEALAVMDDMRWLLMSLYPNAKRLVTKVSNGSGNGSMPSELKKNSESAGVAVK